MMRRYAIYHLPRGRREIAEMLILTTAARAANEYFADARYGGLLRRPNGFPAALVNLLPHLPLRDAREYFSFH